MIGLSAEFEIIRVACCELISDQFSWVKGGEMDGKYLCSFVSLQIFQFMPGGSVQSKPIYMRKFKNRNKIPRSPRVASSFSSQNSNSAPRPIDTPELYQPVYDKGACLTLCPRRQAGHEPTVDPSSTDPV